MTRPVWIAVMLALTLAGCAGSDSPTAPPESELPTLDVTHWTDKTELFMEFPPLVADRTSLYAVHLTRLSDFTAMTTGRPALELSPTAGGAAVRLQGNPPSRPGVFRVEGASPPAGRYRWALLVEAPDLMDRHDLGEIIVYPDVPTAMAQTEQQEDDPAAIAYLKEPQWTNGFGTVQVKEAELRTSIRVPAAVHPLPGGEAIVAAPAAGRFTAESLLSIGDRVRPGQVLGRVEPRLAAGPDRASLEAEVAEARVLAEGARVDLARAEGLLAERAVPARRVEEARRAQTVAEARLKAAEVRLAQRDETLRVGGGAAAGNAFVLRAPISGRLAEVSATLGAAYEEGAPLFRIIRTDRVELEVQVPPADVTTARQAAAVALEIPGVASPLTLHPHHVHDSGVLDATTRALGLQMEVTNPGEQLLVGQAVTAVLYGRNRITLPAVPSAAVLTEAGRPYVFVQLGGEQFARRYVEIASRDGDLVGLRSGVMPGDRVVTRGAYEVQLASAASGLPAEGHVH
ncbi:MAG: efflux RND transporter periplasmic adaptor subunit [Vicinamibacterales bacterium]